MALPKAHRANFEQLLDAAKHGRLALVESRLVDTGEPVAVIALVNFDEHDMVEMLPVACMFERSPFEMLADPTQDELPGNSWPLDMEQLS